MTILCIETSTAVCSAAICRDGELLKQCICMEGSNHARLLPAYIDELLDYARHNAIEIEGVALSEGPGSYTGLRIGTSTAKGLCYGMDIPLYPVSTLEVLCEAARRSLASNNEAVSQPSFIPMIDARRMEVYTTDGGGKARAVVVENEESLSGDNEADFYYFGDGAAKCQKVFSRPNWHYLPSIVPQAQYMGALVERMTERPSVDIAYYEPYYLKEFIAAQSHVKGLK